MDKKKQAVFDTILSDYLQAETKTSIYLHSTYVNLHPCVYSFWGIQMRVTDRSRRSSSKPEQRAGKHTQK